MKTFLKATEVWVPSNTETELTYVASTHQEHTSFHSVTKNTRFGFNQGLPGKAWAARRPMLMKTSSAEFLRRDAALKAGITTAIALPIFAGTCLTGVVVFLCGDDADTVGAIEAWHCDTRRDYDLRLQDGYFGNLEHFEAISRLTAFRQGTGLPGKAWELGMPLILPDLGKSHQFVRFEGAQKAGMTMGLGIPLLQEDGQVYVMTFLSAKGTPVARQVEIWTPDSSREVLQFHSGHAEGGRDLASINAGLSVPLTRGLLGRVFLTGRPLVGAVSSEDVSLTHATGCQTVSAIPVLDGGVCNAVVALFT